MATVAHGLFIQPTTGNFLDNPTGPTYGIDPLFPFIGGDLVAFETYFFGDYIASITQAPLVRYPGASVVARLRAQGNNTIYATASQLSEIVPAAPSVTSLSSGGQTTTAKQAILFNAVTGSFKLIFSPPSADAGPPGQNPIYYIAGEVEISARSSAEEIANAINNSPIFYEGKMNFGGNVFTYIQGPVTASQLRNGNGAIRIIDWTKSKGFTVVFGGIPAGGVNQYLYNQPDIQIGTTAIGLQQTYGWKVDLLLDGNGHTFGDLFLAANAPAYLEIVLTPSGGSPQLFQREITGSGGGPPPVPPPPPGGGPPPPPPTPPPPAPPGVLVNISGVLFDGLYDEPFMIGQPEISHGIPDDSSSIIWRQKYQQRLAKWSPLTMGGGGCPFNNFAVATDETSTRWTGIGDIVEFEREWSMIPNSRRRPGSWSKTYKAQAYIYNTSNGAVDPSTFSITSRTAIIGADLFYDYFNIAAQGIPIPAIPDVAVVHNGPFHYYEYFGGFPHYSGGTPGTNFGYVLIGVDTRPYRGAIWERLLVYGQ